MLQRWWSKKYRLPPTSDEYLRYTNEELWLEFYSDYYENNPNEPLDDAEKNDDVQFVTGDEDFDRLEQMIADGASDEDVERELASWEVENEKLVDELGDGFDDDYT